MPTSHLLDSLTDELRASLLSQKPSNVFVAFSGGVDSRVLLELACSAIGSENVTALHVNHGLSSNSEKWEAFCQETAENIGCHFKSERVQLTSSAGIEAEARRLRYQFFDEQLPSEGVLLLGHHLDDQVETFFLRLMRGAGLEGLQAMQSLANRHHYSLFRPLLHVSKEQLIDLARTMQIDWVSDESNESSKQDRNFLRNEVLPLIETRWPAYRDRIVQAQSFLNNVSQERQVELAEAVQDRLSHDGGLKMVNLSEWTRAQKLSLLHHWLTKLGKQIPSKTRLEQILDTVVVARSDATPSVEIDGGFVRRHGPALYWVAPAPDIGDAPDVEIGDTRLWPGVGRVGLCEIIEGTGLDASLPNLHWRLRHGSEQIRPEGRSKSRDLKRIMQEYRIKPWLRDRTPLLYSGDSLVAVGENILSADHLTKNDQLKLRVIWHEE